MTASCGVALAAATNGRLGSPIALFLGTGCPPCSYRRGAALAATPRAGRSFADVHPELVRFFVADETNPEKTLRYLKPSSTDRCRWTCPHCGRPSTARPQQLHRNP